MERPEEKKRSYELDEESKQVLNILKAHEGRAVQKEIREILNYSEPKMSLIIGELEALGFIKRIKKGRQNILKLVREKW